LNEEILGCGHLGIKRFFALDHQAYEPGPLGTKTKELLGLVASAVLRCAVATKAGIATKSSTH
jgi:alkylhydroperoxidase/carboxymuconolactone decarboxylase family protein YurZ